jgi:hypothetical protein
LVEYEPFDSSLQEKFQNLQREASAVLGRVAAHRRDTVRMLTTVVDQVYQGRNATYDKTLEKASQQRRSERGESETGETSDNSPQEEAGMDSSLDTEMIDWKREGSKSGTKSRGESVHISVIH